MTPEQTKEAIAVMQAYCDGKEIETTGRDSWFTEHNPRWDWLTSEYRIADPYRALKEAHAAGKTIQFNQDLNEGDWLSIKSERPGFCYPVEHYRIKPEDPYEALKEAHKAGKTIQVVRRSNIWVEGTKVPEHWEDINPPLFGGPVEHYRIKPEPKHMWKLTFSDGSVDWSDTPPPDLAFPDFTITEFVEVEK